MSFFLSLINTHSRVTAITRTIITTGTTTETISVRFVPETGGVVLEKGGSEGVVLETGGSGGVVLGVHSSSLNDDIIAAQLSSTFNS